MSIQPQLPGLPPDTVYVNFHDVIDDVRVRSIMEICTNIIQQFQPPPQRLYFGLSSPGGSVAAGVALYSFLRSLPVKLTMHNIGSVDSIATAIFMAADDRRACAHSSFLFHGVATGFGQGVNLNAMQLREILSSVNQDESKIAQIVTARSAITVPEMQELFKQGEAKPPSFALEKGIIQEVCDFVIPIGAPIVTINVKQAR